jgi:thiamine-phosphate pyrophosphorylase
VPAVLSPLYVICDPHLCRQYGWQPADFAAACFEGGARLLQVRAKTLPGRDFLDLTTAIVRRAESTGALIIVNDRADIARLSSAGGVHVGQGDLSPAQVRAVVGDAAVVGLSTHTPDQLESALRQAVSYVAIGPVFGTGTKDTGFEPLGLDRVRSAARRTSAVKRPLVAIGGVTLANAGDVIRAGAQSVAVISDLFAGNDPRTRVRQFLEVVRRASD